MVKLYSPAIVEVTLPPMMFPVLAAVGSRLNRNSRPASDSSGGVGNGRPQAGRERRPTPGCERPRP